MGQISVDGEQAQIKCGPIAILAAAQANVQGDVANSNTAAARRTHELSIATGSALAGDRLAASAGCATMTAPAFQPGDLP